MSQTGAKAAGTQMRTITLGLTKKKMICGKRRKRNIRETKYNEEENIKVR